MQHNVSGRSIVVVAEGQVSCDLAEEAAILDVKSGIYYGLNTVGARIWQMIQEPRTVSEVCKTLLEEYEVEPERSEHDLLTLLQELVATGLVEVKGEMDA